MSPSARLKRALVKLLLTLARQLSIALDVSRDSPDDRVKTAYKKVLLRVHPDKPGGSTERTKELTGLMGQWQECQRGRGRPSAKAAPASSTSTAIAPRRPGKRAGYRIHGQATLLTYQKFPDVAHWTLFVQFVQSMQKKWQCKYWTATLETNQDGSPHAHLMVQFTTDRDVSVKDFVFQGISPNASTTDLCGEGFCRKRFQQSVNRGMFYVWADKCGGASFAHDGGIKTGMRADAKTEKPSAQTNSESNASACLICLPIS